MSGLFYIIFALSLCLSVIVFLIVLPFHLYEWIYRKPDIIIGQLESINSSDSYNAGRFSFLSSLASLLRLSKRDDDLVHEDKNNHPFSGPYLLKGRTTFGEIINTSVYIPLALKKDLSINSDYIDKFPLNGRFLRQGRCLLGSNYNGKAIFHWWDLIAVNITGGSGGIFVLAVFGLATIVCLLNYSHYPPQVACLAVEWLICLPVSFAFWASLGWLRAGSILHRLNQAVKSGEIQDDPEAEDVVQAALKYHPLRGVWIARGLLAIIILWQGAVIYQQYTAA